jgi:hypothetical protein
MMTMMMVNDFLLVHFYVVLLDFDYVVEIAMVNDDDHADLMLDLF